METNELVNIWKTLADNKLIDKELAKENIYQIITKKGYGIIDKMKRKIKIDYFVYFFGLIFIPIVTLLVHLQLQHPLINIRSYIGLTFVEMFFIFMFYNSNKKLKFLNYSFNTGSIIDSFEKVRRNLNSYGEKGYWISLLFGYGFLIFVIINFLLLIGGFRQLTFSSAGFNAFASYFIVLMLIFIIIWPFILKFEYKIRLFKLIHDMDQTLEELNSEG